MAHEFVTKPDWLAYPDAEEFLPESYNNWAVYYKRINGLLHFRCDADAYTQAKEWQAVTGIECTRYEDSRGLLIRRPKAKTVTEQRPDESLAWLDF